MITTKEKPTAKKAAAKKPVAKTKEKSLSDLEKQHYARIGNLEKAANKAEIEWIDLKEQASAAKKAWELSVSRLRGCIRKGAQGYFDFSKAPEQPAAKGKGQSKDEPATDSSWEGEPIENALKLTKAQKEKLSEHGVKTVLDFEKLRGGQIKDYPRGLRDLPRVGDATIDKWEEEILNWLTEHRKAVVLKIAETDEPSKNGEPKMNGKAVEPPMVTPG